MSEWISTPGHLNGGCLDSNVVPAGFEPATFRVWTGCSPAELRNRTPWRD